MISVFNKKGPRHPWCTWSVCCIFVLIYFCFWLHKWFSSVACFLLCRVLGHDVHAVMIYLLYLCFFLSSFLFILGCICFVVAFCLFVCTIRSWCAWSACCIYFSRFCSYSVAFAFCFYVYLGHDMLAIFLSFLWLLCCRPSLVFFACLLLCNGARDMLAGFFLISF